jgi:hypothetical protein
MRWSFSILLLVLCGTFSLAQEPRLHADVDSTSYKIGQWIHLRVTADISPQIESIRPAAKDSIGPFEILHLQDLRDQNSQRVWNFRLTTFDSGRTFIAPIPFAYTLRGDTTQRIATTNMVFLTIHGVAIDPQGDIKDIKPPLDAPWLFEDFLPYLIALALLLLGVLAYWYYRKKKGEREASAAPAKPAIPPIQAALAALRDIEDQKLWQQGNIKEYYSAITEVIRRFLEDQYGIRALESTSDEIMHQLKSLPDALSLLKQFQILFTTADLVKFAKYQPTTDEHELELRLAYEIVRSMAEITRKQELKEEKEMNHVG